MIGGTARRHGLVIAVLGIAVVVVVAALAWPALRPRSAAEREAAADGLLQSVHLTATVPSRTLAAADAIADFGIEEGVRLVHVRIVDGLSVEARIETGVAITLADTPSFCLVGPFAAPDDAGLEDRCWGDPDFGAALAAQLPRDSSGRPVIEPGRVFVAQATLGRGQVRCDYPPGAWRLEMKASPLVDGWATAAREIPVAATFEVDWQTPEPIPYIKQTRYCGLASVVYRTQGEPPIVTP